MEGANTCAPSMPWCTKTIVKDFHTKFNLINLLQQQKIINNYESRTTASAAAKPIIYGDVFQVYGDLASQPIAPQDAAMMQTAETAVLGQTQKAGPAASMQAAATINQKAGHVSHDDVTDAAREGGVTVSETDTRGSRIVTESVVGQVVGKFYLETLVTGASRGGGKGMVTIGEAQEAAGRTAGDKSVDHGDAAAIQAAECRETGSNLISTGGIAAVAQSAAAYNDGLVGNEGKVKLAEILSGAAEKLPADTVATREDAERIISAELRNDPDMKTYLGGVAETVAAAARLNEKGSV